MTAMTAAMIAFQALGSFQQNAATSAQAKAQEQQLRAQAAADQYNASIARQNAAIVDQQTQAELEVADKQRRLRAGQAIASAGASGVGIEAFGDTMRSSAKQEKLDLLTIESDGALKANSFRQQANLYDMSATGSMDQIPYVKSAAKSSKAANVLTSVSKGIGTYKDSMGKL